MPQMAPLNWLTLMLFFLIMFIMFNYVNYFSLIYQEKSKFKSIKKTNLNWKW